MKKLDWKKEVHKLYFEQHKKINEVAEIVGKSRKTVSKYLNSLSGIKMEKEDRKKNTKKKRKIYQRRWDMLHRTKLSEEDEQRIMRRSHDVASAILSAEKYFHD